MMKLKCLACEVLARPLYLSAARSPHIVDIELIQKGLHDRPVELRSRLQEKIDQVEGGDYEALLLGYGLCGQSTAGLKARSIPMIVPRAHDCITLFLGSRSRYQDQFDNYPGTYWYAQDYIERSDRTGLSLPMGSVTDTDLQSVYEEYVRKYGKDNADYLMEVMGAWKSHYRRAVFIEMGIGDGSEVEERARGDAGRRGWTFERLEGDMVLIRRLLEGDWENDFLILQPGEEIRMSYDEQVICPVARQSS
jgi:hypothetical protein